MTLRSAVLARVAATLGFVGSVLISSVILGTREVGVSMLFVVCTTVVASQLGRLGGHHIDDISVFAGATVLAGMVNGTLLATVAAVVTGGGAAFAILLGGAIFGGACSLPFLPAMLIAFASSGRVGRSRDGSLLDAADRRAPWLATSITVLVVTVLVVSFEDALNPVVFLCVLAAAASAITLGLRSLRDFRRAQTLDQRAAGAIVPDAMTPDMAGGAERIDVGIGEEERACISRGNAYRTGTRATLRLTGDLAAAKSILTRDVIFGVLAIVAALLVAGRVAAMIPVVGDMTAWHDTWQGTARTAW